MNLPDGCTMEDVERSIDMDSPEGPDPDRARLRLRLRGFRVADQAVPESLHEGIVRYLLDRRRPGGFLSAVIQDRLADAVSRADNESMGALLAIVSFFRWEAPPRCHGSPELFEAWTRGR